LESQIEHIPLRKQRLLEFLGAQKGPITAKVASIDLDTRASTVTEMLERCAAQGLVEREANQRPRQYAITAAGRQRLAIFVPSVAGSELESTPGTWRITPVESTNQSCQVSGTSDASRDAVRAYKETNGTPRGGSKKVRALIDRVRKLQATEAECQETSDSANQAKAETQSEGMRNLYHSLCELRSLGFFDSKNAVRARIAELELDAGKEISERVKRLVSLEVQIRNESRADA
jgi:DNA-binding MarR family transcriptional regulator